MKYFGAFLVFTSINTSLLAVTENEFVSAVANDDRATMEQYLQERNDINERDRDGWTALTKAASLGKLDTVKYLLSKGANINATQKWYWSPLLYAVTKANIDLIKILLSNPNINVNEKQNPERLTVVDRVPDILEHLPEEQVDRFLEGVTLVLQKGASFYNAMEGAENHTRFGDEQRKKRFGKLIDVLKRAERERPFRVIIK